jgi:hypothetical protein
MIGHNASMHTNLRITDDLLISMHTPQMTAKTSSKIVRRVDVLLGSSVNIHIQPMNAYIILLNTKPILAM